MSLGPDLFDAGAGVFTSGTYSWVAYGTNTIANDSNSLKVTYGNNSNGAYLELLDAKDLSADLVVGRRYKLTFDAKVNATNTVRVNITNTAVGGAIMATVTSTSFVSYTHYFTNASGTSVMVTPLMDGDDIIWLDNITLREVLSGMQMDMDMNM